MIKKDEITELTEKADRRFESAKDEFDKGNYDFSVVHAYYSIFYLAAALLLTKDLRFSKHSAVHAAFGQYFAKTEEVSTELHRILLKTFEMRSNGDYEYMLKITKEEAGKTLDDAEIFIRKIKKKLKELNE